MKHMKKGCDLLPPVPEPVPPVLVPPFGPPIVPPISDIAVTSVTQRDWEMHPSWIAGMESLNAYGDWVSSVVLPIAFQWIEDNKPEVYATVSEEFKDDVGVVMAAAVKLVKDLPAYKRGLEKSAAYESELADGTFDPKTTNPLWTRITQKVREETAEIKAREEAFAEYSSSSVPAKIHSMAL